MVPDTAVWTQIKPDTLHRRLSHSSAQVGSCLFISGGHDGSEYSLDLLLFNLGKLPSLMPRLSPALRNTNSRKIKYHQQFASHYDTVSLQYEPRSSVVRPFREVITRLSPPTRGSSFLADSTDTKSLTTCIYWTLLWQRISRRSQASALMRNDDTDIALSALTVCPLTFLASCQRRLVLINGTHHPSLSLCLLGYSHPLPLPEY